MKRNWMFMLLYMAVMGLSLAWCRFSRGISYSDPGFVSAMLVPLLILTAVSAAGWCFTVHEDGRFRPGKGRYGLFALTAVPEAIIAVSGMAFSAMDGSFSIRTFVSVMLVGAAEELMFRGVVFRGLMKMRGTAGAVLISSVCFSLLHALNAAGGQSVPAVAVQLVMTFCSGLYFSSMYVRIGRLWPLVLQHGLWDWISFSGIADRVPAAGMAMPVLILAELVIAVIIIIRERDSMPVREMEI